MRRGPRAFYVPPATLSPRRATTARKANRSPFDAFYGSKRWKMSRRAQLTEHPLCQFRLEDGRECGAIADSVHHIVELTEGRAPRDPANLLSTWRSHHAAIHAQRRRGVAQR